MAANAANITFNFELADQGDYKAVLWADYIASDATATSGHYPDKYYKTDDADGLKKVTIIEEAYTYTDGVREAFAAVEPFTKGATAKNDLTATLVRPLTKVTIAEKNDEMFGKCTGMTATYTVPSEFNAFSEEVSVTATYAATYNAAPMGGDISINGNSCKILFSDYVFAVIDGTMGGIKLTFTGSETLNDRYIPANIPLKRNNWVRAAGNLITGVVEYDPAVVLSVDMTTIWVDKNATDIPDFVTKPKVGDYYYKNGTYSSTYTDDPSNPCIGIVCRVMNDGISGRVVSLTEPSGLVWTAEENYEVTGAKSIVNGKANTSKIFAGVANGTLILANYPIFEACQKQRTDTENDGWYIPHSYVMFFANIQTTLTTAQLKEINQKITALGGVPLIKPTGQGNAYWSSAESNESQAHLSMAATGDNVINPKNIQARVRFVLDF